jgi:hypothetical protein
MRRRRVIVWVWDASGPKGDACGVSTEEADARRAAVAAMFATGAAAAVVESAAYAGGGGWMADGYRRIGFGFVVRAAADGSHIWWAFNRRVSLAAS